MLLISFPFNITFAKFNAVEFMSFCPQIRVRIGLFERTRCPEVAADCCLSGLKFTEYGSMACGGVGACLSPFQAPPLLHRDGRKSCDDRKREQMKVRLLTIFALSALRVIAIQGITLLLFGFIRNI